MPVRNEGLLTALKCDCNPPNYPPIFHMVSPYPPRYRSQLSKDVPHIHNFLAEKAPPHIYN